MIKILFRIFAADYPKQRFSTTLYKMTLKLFTQLATTVTIAFFSLTACFTGIESTPKITADELKKDKKQPTSAEDELSAIIIPDSPSTWQPGRQYLVADNRIKLIFSTVDEKRLPSVGDTVIYNGFSSVPSLTGTTNVALKFHKKNDPTDILTYIAEISPDDFLQRQRVDIPFLVDLSLVNKANQLLGGKSLYIMSPYRYDMENHAVNGRKYIRVTVNNAVAGNADYPIRVNLTDIDNKSFSVLMTTGTDRSSTRNFSTLFSTTDPRQRYQSITDENWEAITYSRLKPYMTRDEARLAVGSPTEIDRGHSYSSAYERWVYPNGTYIIFEDGIIKSFRL